MKILSALIITLGVTMTTSLSAPARQHGYQGPSNKECNTICNTYQSNSGGACLTVDTNAPQCTCGNGVVYPNVSC